MSVNKANLIWNPNVNDSTYIYRFSWFHLVRPMTFTGTISPVIAGTAIAAITGTIRFDIFIVMLVAALFVQSAANMLNDFFDLKSGQDREKWTTHHDQSISNAPVHHAIPFAAVSLIILAVILGVWLSIQSSWWVGIVGALGIIIGYAYSAGPKSLAALGLGELTAAIFLGFVTTTIAFGVQGHAINGQILAVSFPFALLIASMILSNNLRDIEKDAGYRFTLVMRMGRIRAFYLLTVIISLVYVWVLALVIFGIIPWTSVTFIIAIPLAVRLIRSYRIGAPRTDEIKGMKWAALHHWTFGLSLGFGLWLGVLIG